MGRLRYERLRRFLVRQYRTVRVRYILRERIQGSTSLSISRNVESLQDTLTDAQRELFAQYLDSVREFQDMAECLLFQNSFRLGARMMLEIMNE